MGRKVRRVPVVLDPSDEPPTPGEMDATCACKTCRAQAADCAVPGCGAVPLVQVFPGFTFDPVRAFANRPQVLWRRGETSTVERWYAEVHGITNA
jgi:hypothetical protein